ncbi:MAG: hypothetical protein AB3N07_03780 [Ruegeria sp.]
MTKELKATACEAKKQNVRTAVERAAKGKKSGIELFGARLPFQRICEFADADGSPVHVAGL